MEEPRRGTDGTKPGGDCGQHFQSPPHVSADRSWNWALNWAQDCATEHWARNWMLPETAHFVAAAGSLTSSLYLNSSEGAQRSSRMVRFGVSFQVVTRLLARGAV